MKRLVISQRLINSPPTPKSEDEIVKGWKGGIDKPRVSVLCTAYNHAPYIEEALNSFLMQETDFPFEIIVHDDASTDGTREILEKYQHKYPNIINIISQKNNQFSRGKRPIGFFYGRFKGDYFALCEGDDFWMDNKKLEKQVLALDVNSSVGVCVSSGFKLNSEGVLSESWVFGSESGLLPTADLLSRRGIMAPTASFFFRRKEYYSFPDWLNEAPVGDSFMLLSAARNVGVYYIRDPMVVYRVESSGSWSEKQKKIGLDGRVCFMRGMIRSYLLLAEELSLSTEMVERRIENYRWELAFISLRNGKIIDFFNSLYCIGLRGVLIKFYSALRHKKYFS